MRKAMDFPYSEWVTASALKVYTEAKWCESAVWGQEVHPALYPKP